MFPSGQRPILFAAPAPGEPTEAFMRACVIADTLARELRVLRVLAPGRRTTSPATICARVVEQTSKWCDRVQPQHARRRTVTAVVGDFISVVTEAARATTAQLVVIPSGPIGRSAHGLARESQTPVLLARPPRGSAIIAASNLTRPGFPVLRAGATLSRHLRFRVVFLHNIASPTAAAADTRTTRAAVVERLADLNRAAYELDVYTQNLITTEPTTAEAILSISDREQADVVVVGANMLVVGRATPPLAVDELIDAQSQSILIVPIRDSATGPIALVDQMLKQPASHR